ncbi:unnamed protein product [Moneuplotes crassus]|uniref:Uncharacterized protein n=1 Tax=Euplotes crassus TaxID=5936 RepID=A0AAD1U7V2_EUPCR|nr:unnamed protein product [Moneuplotes crassus]
MRARDRFPSKLNPQGCNSSKVSPLGRFQQISQNSARRRHEFQKESKLSNLKLFDEKSPSYLSQKEDKLKKQSSLSAFRNRTGSIAFKSQRASNNIKNIALNNESKTPSAGARYFQNSLSRNYSKNTSNEQKPKKSTRFDLSKYSNQRKEKALEKNITQGDLKHRYESLLDKYFHKPAQKEVHREGVESKIKRYQELLNMNSSVENKENDEIVVRKTATMSDEGTKETFETYAETMLENKYLRPTREERIKSLAATNQDDDQEEDFTFTEMEQDYKTREERWKIQTEKLNSWRDEFEQKFKTLEAKTSGLYNKNDEKELNEENFKNNYKDIELVSTINQSDGFKSYFGEYKTINDPEQLNQQEDSKCSDELCEQEESSQQVQVSHKASKPPIYRKSKNQSFDRHSQSQSKVEYSDNESAHSRIIREESEDPDSVDQNLQGVEESLNGLTKIIQSNNSVVKYSDENQRTISEIIPIEVLFQWQMVFKETSPDEIGATSMEYKNELLNLASLISDLLSSD